MQVPASARGAPSCTLQFYLAHACSQSLVKVLNGKEEYSYLEELKAGVAAAKRITDRINEEQRRAENKATVKSLEGRVEDWKGHHISNFGALLLDDIFTVTKSEMDREYHVFLFEKIILCCKEYTPTGPNAKKVSKSNSILKKPAPPPLNIPFGQSGSKKRNTPLLLKGRIFLNNVTSAVPKGNAGKHRFRIHVFLAHDVQVNIHLLSTGRAMTTSSTLLYGVATRNSFASGRTS